MILRLLAVLALATTLLNGCSGYQMDIQQGNYITQEQLSQVSPGMTQEQVRELLGTPLLTDDFRKNRWDYVFYLKKGKQLTRQTGVTVFFDAQGRVSDLRQDSSS